MSEKCFNVAAIGLEEVDMVALKRILSMTKSRPRSYEIVEMKGGNAWDILVVRAGDKLGKSLQFAAQAEGGVGVLTVGNASELSACEFSATTPLMPATLIDVLDQITISVLHYVPELTISEDIEKTEIQTTKTRSQLRNKNTYRALVIDDSEPIRKQMAMSLDMLGIEVETAENSDDAFLALNQRQDYHIIFLDVVMPGMNGFDVCKNIKKNTKTKHIPVIMLTGKTSRLDKVKGSMVGCQNYLTKPLDNSELQEILNEYAF